MAFRYVSSNSYSLQLGRYNIYLPLALSLFLVFWLGFRPISGVYFGDTGNYALEYALMDTREEVEVNWKNEWVWTLLMQLCKTSQVSVSVFFTIVEAGYILLAFWAIKRFIPSNPLVGMLFVLSSLMFYNFGINGLRNGLACSVVLLGITYFLDDKYWKAAFWAFLAFGIHRSVILPIMAVIAGRYFIKNYRYAVYLWVGCIVVSLFAGNIFMEFFSSLGFDDRMTSYLNADYEDTSTEKGFRWDFLLYSTPPIVFAWYLIIKRGINDGWYNTLSIAYCLANAFWVLIIRVAFTNRFAYLSWFLYPVLIAYPLINLPIWKNQDKIIGIVLAFYCCFTLILQMIIW